jgi:hypothetical protein
MRSAQSREAEELFPDGKWKVHLLCNLGYGDQIKVYQVTLGWRLRKPLWFFRSKLYLVRSTPACAISNE